MPVSRKRKQETPRKAPKRGDAYQSAVAQVARTLVPNAHVEVGTWVEGPDGHRDLDVAIRASPGAALQTVIECKDWNRPIGIAFVDALESKRRDLGAQVAMLCSNSGFTEDALRKAARVGIPMLSALIAGDERIRIVVREQIYTRLITYVHHGPLFHHQQLDLAVQARLADLRTTEFVFLGKSMEAWVTRVLLDATLNATQSGSFVRRYFFQHPLILIVRGVQLEVGQIDVHGTFEVQWMTQVAEIGASQGMYDHLRHVVLQGPGGAHQFHVTVNSETWGTPVSISDVPERLLRPLHEQQIPGVTQLTLGMVKNMPTSNPQDAPDLAALIAREEIESGPVT